MFSRLSIPQSDPPRSPRETLPTMYDLPSEDPQESGLPDEFHDLQPRLLSSTLRLPTYASDNRFIGTNLNLYYDSRHPLWYKRPDWFLVPGVSRLYDGVDMRLSYVVWQEGVSPFVAVELLSPGTEDEDLGTAERLGDRPPTKWYVYEQILRIPYYVLFDRYTDSFRVFGLQNGRYQELNLSEQRLWISELQVGIGVWQGTFEGVTRKWLRWYDAASNWLPTDAERFDEQEQSLNQAIERAESAEERAQALAERLRSMGINPDEIV
ncbi:MAG: Uma2 family endonuclease [Cyanobacteria bacterium J06638_22]